MFDNIHKMIMGNPVAKATKKNIVEPSNHKELDSMTKKIVKTSIKPKTIIKKPNKEISISWKWRTSSLNQIYSRGLEFCFISNEYGQATDFVLCKDFLHDALMATHHSRSINVYGFKYDPKKNKPIALDKVRLAVTNSQDKDFGRKIPRCLEFIRQAESELGLVKTIMYSVANPPRRYKNCGVWIFDGSSRWILSPPMISLYTLLIRTGIYHRRGHSWRRTIKDIIKHKLGKDRAGESGGGDASQLQTALIGIERIIKEGYANIFYKDAKDNFPNINKYSMHDSYGICGFTYKSPSATMKQWYKTKKG